MLAASKWETQENSTWALIPFTCAFSSRYLRPPRNVYICTLSMWCERRKKWHNPCHAARANIEELLYLHLHRYCNLPLNRFFFCSLSVYHHCGAHLHDSFVFRWGRKRARAREREKEAHLPYAIMHHPKSLFSYLLYGLCVVATSKVICCYVWRVIIIIRCYDHPPERWTKYVYTEYRDLFMETEHRHAEMWKLCHAKLSQARPVSSACGVTDILINMTTITMLSRDANLDS